MKIRSIKITEFGGLKDFSLELSDSLNIINGNNESGKSTVLLFICYMLYGLAKKGAYASVDKARSISAEGGRAEGQMDVEADGKIYRIVRSLKGKSTASKFKVYDLSDGSEVECESPADLFLFGVPRETFESCCLCGQLRASGINGTQVSETLSNLSLGADESVNADAVIDSLRKARKEYKHERGRGGLIDDNADELLELSEQRLAVLRALEEKGEAAKELGEKRKELTALQNELDKAEKTRELSAVKDRLARLEEQKKTLSELDAARSQLKELPSAFGLSKEPSGAMDHAEMRHLCREYETKKENLLRLEGARSTDTAKIDIKAKEAAERINAEGGKDAAKKRALTEQKSIAAHKRLAVAFSVAAVAAFALGAFLLPLIFAGALLCALTVCFAVSASKKNKSYKERFSVRSDMSAEEYIDHCFAQLEVYNAQKDKAQSAELAKSHARAELDRTASLVKAKLCDYNREADGEPIQALYILSNDVARYIDAKERLEKRIAVCLSLCERQKNALIGVDESALRKKEAELLAVAGLSDSDATVTDDALVLLTERKKALEERITSLRIKLEGSGADENTLAEIEQRRAELEKTRAELTDRYEIYGLAIEALEAGRDVMQNAFAPDVRKRAGELLAKISGGRYQTLFLSQKLDASVFADGAPRDSALLSGGTSDALYIALRLALAEKIFGAEAPFILDETLAQVDDTRAAQVLTLLSDRALSGCQCLVFSCHKREAALCKEHGIDYNGIEI